MIKLIIGLLIIACIAPLFIKGPDGEPIMTLDDWKVDVPRPVKELVARIGHFNSEKSNVGHGNKGPRSSDGPASRSVYKWQDEDGQWHFSNAPPNPDIAEEIEIGDVNLMEAYLPPAQSTASSTPGENRSMVVPSGMATSGQVEEMMETVDQFQKTMNQRKEALDALSAP